MGQDMSLLSSLVQVIPPRAVYRRTDLEPNLNALGPWQEAVDQFVLAEDFDGLWSRLVYPAQMVVLQLPPARLKLVRELLDRNAACLDALDRGIQRGRLQFAEFQSLEQISADTDFVSRLGDVARLHILRFRIGCADCDLVAAAEALFCLEKIGSMICGGEGQMLHYMVGLWLRAVAVRGFGQLAARMETPRGILERIVRLLADGLKAPDGFAESLRVDLCTITLAQLERTVEGPNLEAVVDKLLEVYYVPQLRRTAMAQGSEPAAIADGWLEERRRQLLLLLDSHPQPLDRGATARLMAANVIETIRDLHRARRPAFLDLVGQLHGMRRKLRLHGLARKTRFWRVKSAPVVPGGTSGKPPRGDAITTVAVAAENPTGDRLTALKARLRRIDNPLGLMLFEQFLARDYIPHLLEHLKMMRTMHALIKQRLAEEGEIRDEV